MKIDLRNKVNKDAIRSVRSQIKAKGDLKKFDEFIAKHEIFDISNDAHMKAAQGSCSNGDGPKCTFTLPPIKL